MKNRSIRRIMMQMIGGILAAMLLFHLLTAYSNSRTIKQLNQIVEAQLLYDSYKETVDTIQEYVTSYFNRSEKITTKDIETLCIELKNSSLKLEKSFPHPQFTDHVYIVQSYLEAIHLFLDYEQQEEKETTKQFEYYNETMSLYRMTLSSYETTQPFEKEMITWRIHESSVDWRKKENAIFMLGIGICILGFWRGKRFVDALSFPIIALTEKTHQIMYKNYEEIQEKIVSKNMCRETILLAEAFDKMAKTIRQQMEELQEKITVSQKLHKLQIENMQTKMTLNQTQMSLMQSLISPHFLFNCLSTLTSLAFIEEAPRTEECSIKLAKFLRKFLDHIGKTVTIQEEVEHTQQYIEIQKMRFSKRILFEINCEETCADQKIPAIILQPLVENALSHGLKNCRCGGWIRIDIRKNSQKEIMIKVWDNGEGIEKSRIEQIKEDLKKPFESGEKGIGLRSIAYRLNDFFQGHAVIDLQKQEKGTCAIIQIPATEII